MARPWTPEIPITSRQARRLIEGHFPELSPARVVLLGGGWDNTVFLVNGEWVFRFPRRHIAVGLMQAEAAVLPRLAPHLPLPIPVPRFVTKPDSGVPPLFSGYRWIEGTPSCRADLDADGRGRLAIPLAGFLRTLHGMSYAEASDWGLPGDRFRRLDLESRKAPLVRVLESLQQAGITGGPAPWRRILEGTPRSYRSEQTVLVHGDLHGCQLLISEEGRLSGVIDWGDVHLGDPAVDLAVAWSSFPAPGREEFRRAYGEVPEQCWQMARFRALFTTVMLAGYARQRADEVLLQECCRGLSFLLEET